MNKFPIPHMWASLNLWYKMVLDTCSVRVEKLMYRGSGMELGCCEISSFRFVPPTFLLLILLIVLALVMV